VECRIDGWLLDDDATGSPEATGDGFPLTYTFSEITPHPLLVGRAFDGDGDLVAEGSAYIDVETNAFLGCAVAASIACGQTISGTTLGAGASDVLHGYPNAVGNWSGPEVAYTWSGGAGEVEIALLNADPGAVDHDVIILEQSAGTCVAVDQALIAFNSLRFETTPGARYAFVVDGYDGDAGAFELHLDCDP
jgi:hypothetical protein